DNTPLYLKFSEPVNNAVRRWLLHHGPILPGERYFSQLTGVSLITVRKALPSLAEARLVPRSRG
ncbi:GntR family transcriptional regulator, partial [Escherichia coli]